LPISESEQDIINLIADDINIETLIIFWQLVLKVVDELSLITNPILSLEMLVVRLLHIKAMPSYENLLDSIKETNVGELNNSPTIELTKKEVKNNEENVTVKQSKDQIKNTVQTKPVLSSSREENLSKNLSREKVSSFEDLIYLAAKKKEIQLKYDLERNVNLIKFSEGKIDISFNQKLDKNFVRNLSAKLVEWTGNRWVITLSKEAGNKTFLENEIIKKKELLNRERNSELYKKFKDIFSDIELLEIKKKD